MRTRVPLIAAALLVATVTAGCDGPFRDEIAATVDGRDISTAEVEAVVRDAEALQLGADAPEVDGRRPADVRRAALTLLVQDAVLAAQLERLGEDPTAEDQGQADQRLANLPTDLDPDVESMVRRLVLNGIAVTRITAVDAAQVDDAAVAAFFAANRDQFGDLTCLEGLAGFPEAVGTARASIEAGGSFDAAVAADPNQVSPIDPAGTAACVTQGTVRDPGLAAVIEGGAVDELQQYDTENQGQAVSLLIRVTSRRPAQPTDDIVATQIRQQLEAQAQQQAQQQQQQVIERLLRRADITIDPRYGRLDRTGANLIEPPLSPATTAPAALSPAP